MVSNHPLAVELRGLSKRFGTVQANASVNLCVEPGTIHGVIGENGAGKSTAMKMLYGLIRPDSGEIRIDGKAHSWSSPREAIAAGIGMVHQHFMLAEPYTALENILLASYTHPFQLVKRSQARSVLENLSQQYGLQIPWDTPVEELAVGIQQRIEILKLLYQDARILILDEPTAVLTPQETEELFTQLRKLKSEGKTILIITHKLKEVMSITDRITVFRAGQVTAELKTSETNPQELAEKMVGRSVTLTVEKPEPPESGPIVLKAENLTLKSSDTEIPPLSKVSFEVRSGEIVGIAGVEGNGQSEVLRALLSPSNPRYLSEGRLEILGKEVTDQSTLEIKMLGVGFIPEDRHKEALLLNRPVVDNFLLGLQRRPEYSRWSFLDRKKIRDATKVGMDRFDVRPRLLDVEVGGLSGGNQQKLIIAREMSHQPKFLVAAQPTRGVDVGAIEFIHQQIIEARQGGAGVLLVSSELDEILALSDRILVMYRGEIVARYHRTEVTEKELGLAMGGAAKKEAAL